jgi:hypothetical protein
MNPTCSSLRSSQAGYAHRWAAPRVGAGPIALAFDGQKLWVASRDDATVQYVLLHK